MINSRNLIYTNILDLTALNFTITQTLAATCLVIVIIPENTNL